MTNRPKPSPGMLDDIVAKIGKVNAVLAALAALGIGMAGVIGAWRGLVPDTSSRLAPKKCFQAKLSCPTALRVGQWRSMKLSLNVQNTCEDEVFAYVIFKISGAGRIRIEPPFDDNPVCGPEKDKPGCWEERKLEKGSYSWKLTPPNLTRLRDPLGEKFQVDINWVVYNKNDKKMLGSDKAEFWLEDDPLAGNAGNEKISEDWGGLGPVGIGLLKK